MESLPTILFQVIGNREWYENDTISVNKTGINGIISLIGTGTTEDTTIIVNKTGIIGTTTEI